MKSGGGYSLVEALVATALMLVVSAALLALVAPADRMARAAPPRVDMQQRARVGAGAVAHDLLAAGAGLATGPRAGPLIGVLPPILPIRFGGADADPLASARSDALTLLFVPADAPETRLAAPAWSGAASLALDGGAGCRAGAACGFTAGSFALLFDGNGAFDLFAVLDAEAGSIDVHPLGAAPTAAYAAGAFVAEVVVRTYYFDAGTSQLRMADGNASDTPVIDHVVGVTFSYLGDPRPPTAPKPPAGQENCLYDAAGMPRGLSTLVADGASLARLPIEKLSDGPWCGGQPYDADLFRIRRIKVALRVEADDPAFRGIGPAFVRAGSSRGGSMYLPDVTMTFDLAPRNLAMGGSVQ